ncbi:acetate/propionate family kinase [Naumannella halotolerans]|uniref:Acetate kinase n=1 Tax=Naumannella halotolerans TaxID=993414 RepID=A0A4R7JBL6_9ACTN|nr:acetate kinase [Naumannella halotolerans]TDT34067.1 acetate kinase [Naumannella halotolerans]
MSGNVLVINSGSSSMKYQVVDAESGTASATGLVERIGGPGGRVRHSTIDGIHDYGCEVADHAAAMQAMTDAFTEHGPDLVALDLLAVGHRVVQGGARFGRSVLIDDRVVSIIEDLAGLAPLHNPANLAGIAVARAQFPHLPQVVVFDTAFHLTMPEHAYTYALDKQVAAEHRIRRYGFHGTSHAFVSRQAAAMLGAEPAQVNVIVLHLGNGASACAVRGGISVDTSMGLTPLEGLVMGTRSGDLDPAVVLHLLRSTELGVDDIDALLNKRSGVFGLSGRQDMRDLEQAVADGDTDAATALEVYCYRLRKYIGAYTAALGRVDAIAFTAGVGENSAVVRALTLQDLGVLGIELDPVANESPGKTAREISTADSAVKVFVIPTNEEWEIARETAEVIAESYGS